jgi:histidine triad (HIT) family protein
MMSDCLFCKIVSGDIPAAKVYEDENVLAFLDIAQVTKGHTLVIPKNHFENMYDISETAAQQLFAAVPKIANGLKKQLEPVGMNLVSNTGKDAGQQIFHIHLHLIPRYGKGDGYGAVWKPHTNEYSQSDLENLAANISEGIHT